MGYTPKKLGHVNIFVRNAERSRDWYEDLRACTPKVLRPDVLPS